VVRKKTKGDKADRYPKDSAGIVGFPKIGLAQNRLVDFGLIFTN